jgi:hypothetical protein
MITMFSDFRQFTAKKWRYSQKINFMIKVLHYLALFLVKNANFVRHFFRQKYLENRNIGPRSLCSASKTSQIIFFPRMCACVALSGLRVVSRRGHVETHFSNLSLFHLVFFPGFFRMSGRIRSPISVRPTARRLESAGRTASLLLRHFLRV